jgi:hypothetical protein
MLRKHSPRGQKAALSRSAVIATKKMLRHARRSGMTGRDAALQTLDQGRDWAVN